MGGPRKRIVWIVSRLTAVGGGERLIWEGARRYRELGFDVHVVTWAFDPKSLFDGAYENRDIHVLGDDRRARKAVLSRAWVRARSLGRLLRLVKKLEPDLLLCQSEYDAILTHVISRLSGVPFSVLIFGQMFQFPEDLAKYSRTFRPHLGEIVASMPGYRDTVSLTAPEMPLHSRWVNELICWYRYHAVRAARARFVFSRQVQWEVEKLYGVTPLVVKGAFPKNIVSFESDVASTRRKLGLSEDEGYFLTLHRLEPKKRTDLAIRAFAAMADSKTRLLIGGTGAEREKLEALIRELGVGNRVKLLGYIPEEEVWPLKQACSLFVSLDIADYDISPLEALALGTKALWTSEIDMDDNLRAARNLFIADPDVNGLAARMSEAFRAPTVNERDRYLLYSWDRYFDSILEHSGIRATC
jgi:glycosyltransferase involved in cell wall biosynthesis